MKAEISSILKILTPEKEFKFSQNSISWQLDPFKKGQSAIIESQGQILGYFGELKHNTFTHMKKSFCFFFEIFVDQIAKHSQRYLVNSVSHFPKNYRDLSCIIKSNITADEILFRLKKNKFKVILNIEIFDVFIGQKIPQGYKSLTLRFVFQGKEKNLTDSEVQKMMNSFSEIIKSDFHANPTPQDFISFIQTKISHQIFISGIH